MDRSARFFALMLTACCLSAPSTAQSTYYIPPVFDRRTYPEAKEALDSGKYLLVFATTTLNSDCQKMRDTTWRDQRVEQWVEHNGMAILLLTSDHEDVCQELGIERIPTTIVIKDGKEFDRVGYLRPDDFMQWLYGLEFGQKSSSTLIAFSTSSANSTTGESKFWLALLAIGSIVFSIGSVIIVTSFVAGRSTQPKAQQEALEARTVGTALAVGGGLLSLGILAWRVTLMIADALAGVQWGAIGLILVLGMALTATAYGWGLLQRKLNAVRRAERIIAAASEKAGVAPGALLEVAKEAGAHERRMHVGIAKAHGTGPLVVIGAYSPPVAPPVTATPLFIETQREIREGESGVVLAQKEWASAAEAYENARASFPLLIVAQLFRFPSVHRDSRVT